VIGDYSYSDFAEYDLPLKGIGYDLKMKKSQKIEGALTKILYLLYDKKSSYEVFKNYESALKKSGYEILYNASKENVGAIFSLASYYGYVNKNMFGTFLVDSDTNEQYALSAKIKTPNGERFVFVFTGFQKQKQYFDVKTLKAYYKDVTFCKVDVLDKKSLDEVKGLVKAEDLAKDIEQNGNTKIYGILFDTGKAEIKPESEQTLQAITGLLSNNKDLNLYVVGHTDNSGMYDSNLELSKNRALAVVSELTTKYKIEASRLTPVGVGQVAPVGSNKTDEGKAKNRRVELVEK
jgi:OmpA-OmpF porin, OOP family